MAARRIVAVTAALALAAGCSSGRVVAGHPSLTPTLPTSTGTPSAGTRTASPSAGRPSSAGPVATSADWPAYHRDAARTGYDPTMPPVHGLSRSWSAPLDGAVYASPLVVGGRVIAATENNSLYALDARTGRVLWRTHVGTPVRLSTLPCGDIDPLGITGTPVYDPATRRIFAVAEVTGPAHLLVGVNVGTGAIEVRRPVERPGGDPRPHLQRAALALGGGRVYVAFGGLYGDCGSYVGAVVGVPTSGSGPALAWTVPTSRQGGIWAPGGPVIDPAGNLYVAIGNGESTSGYDGSDSVTRLTPTLARADLFAPADWAADNASDLDLGSASAALLPGGLVYVNGKSGTGFLLRANALGGVGGQLARLTTCRSFGANAVLGSTVFVPCTDGLRAVRVGPGIRLSVRWTGPSNVDGPPVLGGGVAFAVDTGSGRLYALDVGTGRTRASIDLGRVPHFVSPALSGASVYVGTNAGITAVRAS